MENPMILSPLRQLTVAEQKLVWEKPQSHIESEAEKRICAEVKRNWHSEEMKITNILLEGDAGSGKTQLAKALSANFGLPYTKITCFADMDKSDVLGAILPVLAVDGHNAQEISYQFYPSEIVRAYENGWLLEIQEPTIIRDAAVLMALNSALEPDGSINLPTRIVHRHPDFIAVITTNRGYNGCRPLNEALRDRIQHSEKMDLPPKAVMIERAISKTGFTDEVVLSLLADTIIILDETAKANAIKGVAGMRSYLFWVDAVACGASVSASMYHKVIYKITTDQSEISILEQAISAKGLTEKLTQLTQAQTLKQDSQNPDVMELNLSEDGQYVGSEEAPVDPNAVRLRKSPDSEGHSDVVSDSLSQKTKSDDSGQDGSPIYHEMEQTEPTKEQKQAFRKKLNQEARVSVDGTAHQAVKLIVHRPEISEENKAEYRKQASELMPIIRELVRKTKPLLEHETSSELATAQLYGTSFCASRVAAQDFRYFARKRPPQENPSLAVALRIDESASMSAFGRLDAAKQAAIALYEFCDGCGIPVMIYGDTADRSRMEQMSLYSYVDFDSKDPSEKYSLMSIQSRSNNRDGMALRIVSDRLLKAKQATKLFISISDGQPKAMPDYTGDSAILDMKKTLQEYRRKGIIFLAAAIGQDKEIISDIYESENTLDITDLKQLPARLVQIIAKHM
ncbi:AAA family ATPase [Eubacteriales bacterium OttesenSCG-928-K08]|nr:AAA family ATPase [Eubacteriales bacterium OttesenSCG-928-K08]MDL2288610.1 AAA family ATPase [Oscillospiraceae bacterium OttesenSCG-928-F05]MDL2300085.1 AAA family ATPase [Clostridiaceae bacterium OttesenSCG-928-D20]